MTYYRRRKHNLKHTLLRLVLVIVVLGIGGAALLGLGVIDLEGESGGLRGNVKQNYQKALVRARKVMGERVEEQFLISNFEFLNKDRENADSEKEIRLKAALLSDSQGDNETLEKVLEDISVKKVDAVFHLGDISEGGEYDQFVQTKELLDRYQVSSSPDSYETYVTLPGDHDFNWKPQHSLENFRQVFGMGELNRVIDPDGVRFIIWDNANRDVDADTVNIGRRRWLKEQMEGQELVFVLAHRPFYSPYFKSRVDPRGRDMLKLLRQAVKGSDTKVVVFSGDTHSYARYVDPETGIENITVGAAGTYKNFLPMWTQLTVYTDGSFDIQPKPLTDLIGQ